MPDKLKKSPYPAEFLSPMNAQKPGRDPMPEVNNFGDVAPPDPMGVVPPGSGGGNIGSLTGNKKGK
jgi:hypothetical protein